MYPKSSTGRGSVGASLSVRGGLHAASPRLGCWLLSRQIAAPRTVMP
jgi:hypothetical protein